MADYTQTATSVILVEGPKLTGTAGGTITAGMAIYLNTSDNLWYACDVNDTAAKAVVGGIALNGAAASQPVSYAGPGSTVNLGATLAVGDIVVVSESGALSESADLTSADYASVVGIATTTANCLLGFLVSGDVIA